MELLDTSNAVQNIHIKWRPTRNQALNEKIVSLNLNDSMVCSLILFYFILFYIDILFSSVSRVSHPSSNRSFNLFRCYEKRQNTFVLILLLKNQKILSIRRRMIIFSTRYFYSNQFCGYFKIV